MTRKLSFSRQISRTLWDAESVRLQVAKRYIRTEERGSSEHAGETYIMKSFTFLLINT